MKLHGLVINGNIVLKEDAALPEGTDVEVSVNSGATHARHDPWGILKDLGPLPTEDEWKEFRREMWASFPREIKQ